MLADQMSVRLQSFQIITMRPLIFLLLFVLTTAHCQDATGVNSTQLLEHNSNQSLFIQDFPYIQECPITQTNTTIAGKKTEEETFNKFMAWAYLAYNVMIAFTIQSKYQQEKFCFTFSLILIIGQFHVGLAEMLASDSISSSLMLKGVYFIPLLVANTLALLRIIFLRKLKWRQLLVLFMLMATMLMTGICDSQLYQDIQFRLFIFSPIIHLYNLKEKRKAIDFETISLEEFSIYNNNYFFITSALERCPHIFLKTHTKTQITELVHFACFIGFFYIIFVILPELKVMWVLVSRRIINNVKVKLGMDLEEETCVICLQKMDHFAHQYQRVKACPLSKETDLYEAECGHIFHKKCIIMWGLTKGTCPIDNSTLRL